MQTEPISKFTNEKKDKAWLKIATIDISIQEFLNVITNYKSHYLVPLIQPF